MKKITLFAFLIFFSITHAQLKPKTTFGKQFTGNLDSGQPVHRCSAVEYEEMLRAQNPLMPSKKVIDEYITQRINEIKLAKGSLPNTIENTPVVVTIPVVVHVIHNGDAYGTNENIHDLQVQSQITVLNQDYRRMVGTPGFNTNPVGADVEIEFCLAQRDPNNNPSTGINRVNLGTASYSMTTVNTNVKPQTQWDPNKYLNIWVVNLGGGLLGYAQFPNSSTSTNVAQTDGVVIGYPYFGSSSIYPAGTYGFPYDKGRTLTHEVGHFFGLYHIWGDNNSCVVDATDSEQDFCLDTPAASDANGGCPIIDSCPVPAGIPDMVQNYMDYTNDLCMNIFTQNQKTRMLAVLNSFPRRLQLLTSNGCVPVQTFGLDATVNITNLNVSCGNTLSPVLSLVNNGSTVLTSASLSYNIDGNNPQTLPWTGSLATGQSATINIGNITTTSGAHTFNVGVVSTNGSPDENPANNNKSENFTIVSNFATNTVNFRLQLDFYGQETTWTLKNSAGTTLYSGGNYPVTTPSNAEVGVMGALIQATWTLANNDCYTFTINDSYGDGVCCQYGAGYYDIKTPTNEVIISGGTFTNTESKSFAINLLSVGDANAFEGMYVYPNPANDQLNVFVSNEIGLPESYVIYNTLGQVIANKSINSTVDLNINTSNYSNGVYFIKLAKENQSKTLRFIKK